MIIIYNYVILDYIVSKLETIGKFDGHLQRPQGF